MPQCHSMCAVQPLEGWRRGGEAPQPAAGACACVPAGRPPLGACMQPGLGGQPLRAERLARAVPTATCHVPTHLTSCTGSTGGAGSRRTWPPPTRHGGRGRRRPASNNAGRPSRAVKHPAIDPHQPLVWLWPHCTGGCRHHHAGAVRAARAQARAHPALPAAQPLLLGAVVGGGSEPCTHAVQRRTHPAALIPALLEVKLQLAASASALRA